MGMEELSYEGQRQKVYADVLAELEKKIPMIEGVKVDISVEGTDLVLSIGEHSLYLTPDQAVDLMQEIRRAVVKVNPKALYPKKKRHKK